MKLRVAPSLHLVLDLLELSQYMCHVRFDKHKKSSLLTYFSHHEYGFHQRNRGRSSLEEEPKNLVLVTELIRVHKKTMEVKYEPKAGQTPIPLVGVPGHQAQNDHGVLKDQGRYSRR